jgi:two-component system, response regulator, stage 0 sporulation protein F
MSAARTCGIVPNVPAVPSVTELRERVRGWLHREPKVVIPRTILIVESDAPNRQSVGRMVESLGYATVQTSSVAGALKKLDESDFDPAFVLLGFDVDDATGLEALKLLREVEPGLRVIMLAANVWDPRAAEAMHDGALAYLAKPFGMDDLRELLGRRS